MGKRQCEGRAQRAASAHRHGVEAGGKTKPSGIVALDDRRYQHTGNADADTDKDSAGKQRLHQRFDTQEKTSGNDNQRDRKAFLQPDAPRHGKAGAACQAETQRRHHRQNADGGA